VASNEETNRTDAENWINHTRHPADGYKDLGVLAQRIHESLQKVASDLSPLLNFVYKDDSSYKDKYIIHPYEVVQKLSRINILKSVGPDNITNWILRDFAFALLIRRYNLDYYH